MAAKTRKAMMQEELINTIIQSKGTSQAWVGRKIGRKQTAINRTIKHGNMSVDMLYTIMDALGCEIVIRDKWSDAEYTLIGTNISREGDAE